MKRILSSVIVVVMLLCLTPLTFATSFTDINDPVWGWAKPFIVELSDSNIVTGYPDGTYMPSNNVTKQEAIVFLARMLGYNNPANELLRDSYVAKYETALSIYDTYAKKEASFLLFKGALSESELANYLKADKIGTSLQRYEAAIVLTKALGGDKEVSDMKLFDLSFADTPEIPALAKGYVKFINDKGIMLGMDANKFMPLYNVTRAQMAVMLSKTMKLLDTKFSKGIVSDISNTSKTITIRLSDDNKQIYSYTDSLVVTLLANQSTLDNISIGTEVIISVKGNTITRLDAIGLKQSLTVKGTVVSKTTLTSDYKIKINVNNEGNEMVEFPIGKSLTVSYNGSASSFADIKVDDYVTVTVVDGSVSVIVGESKTKTITSAVVEAIETGSAYSLTISHSNANLAGKYDVVSNVTVKRNGSASSLREIVVGDTVNLTLEYDKITSIVATSKEQKTEGTISEITIAQMPSIKLDVNGKTESFALSRDTVITLDGVTATIYDLRLGFLISVTYEGKTITKVTVKTVSSPSQLNGTVEVVNASAGFINVKLADGKIVPVFAKSGAVILDSKGTKRDMSYIKVGNTVSVTGAEKLGIFEAATIVIVSN